MIQFMTDLIDRFQAPMTASVGVDVDDLKHYYRIHGLDESAAGAEVWTKGVPRFLELFKYLGIEATFYCVAEDFEGDQGDQNREILRAIVEAGHEVANHTWHHPYALTRLSDEERLTEVEEGRKRLEEYSGTSVIGFRSPGYLTNAALQADLRASGHLYDSSVFPCVPYYLAKSGILAWMALRGLKSESIQGSPEVLCASRRPYWPRLDDPFKISSEEGMCCDAEGHCEMPLKQYPVSVALGIPLIGTAFTAIGKIASIAACKTGLLLNRHVTLEFHGVDLLDCEDTGEELGKVQPDLRASVARKRAIFEGLLGALKEQATVMRLDQLHLGG